MHCQTIEKNCKFVIFKLDATFILIHNKINLRYFLDVCKGFCLHPLQTLRCLKGLPSHVASPILNYYFPRFPVTIGQG